MQNDTNKPYLHKHATILKCEDGIATLRIHTDSHGCRGCGGSKQSSCALYTFGSIFSRHSNIRKIPTKHSYRNGEQVQLLIPSDVLLKIAASYYGLPIVILVGSSTLAHLFLSTEWLTVLIGLGSFVASHLLIKKWLHSIPLPDIQLTQ